MSLYLGVDGGGTKTDFVLMDGDARVLRAATGPTSYAIGVGIDAVRAVLHAGVAAVLGGLPPESVDFACFALPAHGESSRMTPLLDALPGEVLGHDRAVVVNDAVAGWAGALGGADGVNVVAGTGSIAYGELRGAAARVGGWGELFGDEGSGHWVAVQALNAFSRMGDGRLRPGPLHPLLRAAVQAESDLDVSGVVLVDWAGARDRVAALSRVVVAAADAGDEVAGGILGRGGLLLADHVAALRARLGAAPEERIAVSYSGGMFGVPAVLDAFQAALGPAADLRPPLHGPAHGAALYARRAASFTV